MERNKKCKLSLTCPARRCTRQKRGPRTVPDRGTGTCTVGPTALRACSGLAARKSKATEQKATTTPCLTSSARPVFLSRLPRLALGPTSAKYDPGTPRRLSDAQRIIVSLARNVGFQCCLSWSSWPTKQAGPRRQRHAALGTKHALPVCVACCPSVPPVHAVGIRESRATVGSGPRRTLDAIDLGRPGLSRPFPCVKNCLCQEHKLQAPQITVSRKLLYSATSSWSWPSGHDLRLSGSCGHGELQGCTGGHARPLR